MKVFLSSTGRDLKAHREAAFRAIQGLDLQCVRMEDFYGPAEKIEHFDEKKVADCELFVIVVGLVHGTCPEGSDKSYTELEYEAAVKLKKPCFLFVAPEDFLLPANLYEGDANRERQRRFRESAAGRIRRPFTSPEDLATQIAISLGGWLRSPGKSGTLLPTPPEPYFAHPYPLQENFTGRVRERHMLTDWLASGRNVLSLTAIGGMGKSALTWFWLQNDVLPAVKLDGVLWWSFYEREASFAAFVREALQYAGGGQANPADSLFDQIKSLTTLLRQKRLLLVLDGFERELRAYAGLNAAYQGDEVEADGDDRTCIEPRGGRFLQSIASVSMPSRVLLTSRLHPRELDGLAGCRHEDLTALDPDDAVRFFRAQGVTKGTRAEIQAACEPYGYHPLALRLLAGVIVRDRRNPGDIAVAARHPVSAELKGKEKHHILQVAYDAMDQPKRELLSQIAAFRNPMGYEALAALYPTTAEAELDSAVDELIDRGLLLFDRGQARYDLHPVVRQHAYDRLADKSGVHTRLREYFAKAPMPDEEKLKTVDELAPVIELYHHTVRSGLFDDGLALFRHRLKDPLYFRFGACQVCIEMLRGVFPDGEDHPPRLKTGRDQSWAQNELANAYSLTGQSRRAVPLLLMSNTIDERASDKLDLATGLSNVAEDQLKLGQLREAEQNLRRSVELYREIQGELWEAAGRQFLGQLEAYQGRFNEAMTELGAALTAFRRLQEMQAEGYCLALHALRGLLMKNPKEAMDDARRSRELADVRRLERDIIRAEWLLGWALTEVSPSEAETHLGEALTRCRRVNLVELESDILLAWARWHRAAGNIPDAGQVAAEALAIADRCDYRLVQADAHNILAQLALDAGDHAGARQHADAAKERAWCDGPPYCYQPALEEAERPLLLVT